MLPHQALDPPPAHRLALPLELPMHPRAAIGLPAGVMDLPDPTDQTLVLDAPGARWPAPPGVIAGRTDPVQPAHRPHRVCPLAVRDEGEDFAL
jgi:hypothetical protein